MSDTPYPTPFFIAEIGINHNGDINIAKELIDLAVSTGCDAVKFQKRSIDIVYTPELLDSPRQSPWGTTQRAQKEGLEFGKTEYDEIDRYCKEVGIDWFASAWDEESQKFLRNYNCKFNKVASAMIQHEKMLELIAEEGRHTFISTGMSKFEDIDKAVDIFEKYNCGYTLLHCVSLYPCLDEDCNLKMIQILRERYNCPIGYSGHERGVLPSVLAVSLGAVVIERHITLDRAMYGSDQSASLEKRGLDLVIRDSKSVKVIIGDGQKRILEKENEVAKKLRYFKEY